MDELRTDRYMQFAAATREYFAAKPLHRFADDRDRRVVIGRLVVQEDNAELCSDRIELERIKQPVTQFVGQCGTISQNLMETRASRTNPVCKMAQRQCLFRGLLNNEKLVAVLLSKRFLVGPNENAEGSSADGRGMNTVSGVKERCGIERPSRTNRSMGCHKMSSG